MTKGTGTARMIEADRSQLGWDLVDLDAWLSADHLARVIWAFTGTLDLGSLCGDQVRGGRGRAPGHRSARFAGALALCDSQRHRFGARA